MLILSLKPLCSLNHKKDEEYYIQLAIHNPNRYGPFGSSRFPRPENAQKGLWKKFDPLSSSSFDCVNQITFLFFLPLKTFRYNEACKIMKDRMELMKRLKNPHVGHQVWLHCSHFPSSYRFNVCHIHITYCCALCICVKTMANFMNTMIQCVQPLVMNFTLSCSLDVMSDCEPSLNNQQQTA